ncbi:hypothetical protein EZS27_018250 [termite gut metagenome]|uniref:PBP domain-containing protein n=1 Tax=termite gut metagenome TaxID=433724 RepID=A0A5J4RJJ6_9ZZZZ
MKKNRLVKWITLVNVFLFSTMVYAFGGNNEENKTISININGSKFVLPIVEKWINEYKKEHSGITFQIENQSNKKGALSIIVSHPEEEELQSQTIVFAGRYALLPITNPKNPLLNNTRKGLNKKEVKSILFEKDILDDEDYTEEKKSKYETNVYSRVDKQGGASTALANYFDTNLSRIKGKKILGDEIYILNEIKKDSIGFAYNSLNYIYNLQTRNLKPELSLVPLNIKSKQKDVLYFSKIDEVITLLENEEIDLVPVESFGFIIEEKNNLEIISFLKWVLFNGQKYNNELGFLKLDDKTFALQKNRVEDNKLLSTLN